MFIENQKIRGGTTFSTNALTKMQVRPSDLIQTLPPCQGRANVFANDVNTLLDLIFDQPCYIFKARFRLLHTANAV